MVRRPAQRRPNEEAIPEFRELELGCIYCTGDVDPKRACVFWPASLVNAVAHVECHVKHDEGRLQAPVAS